MSAAGTRGSASAGVSAPEALVALLLGLFVVHLGLSTLERLRAAEGRLATRTDALVAMRIARHVLRSEARNGRAGSDWFVDGDSLSLRAFRGTAILCPRDSATAEIVVEYGGERRPDPSKDSLLLLDGAGGGETRALVGVSSVTGPCDESPSAALERWQLDAPIHPGAVLARLFERGSYHLSGSALRYRRGASGRQPLTPEVWSDSTRWTLSGNHLGMRAEHLDSTAGPAWSVFLAWLEP